MKSKKQELPKPDYRDGFDPTDEDWEGKPQELDYTKENYGDEEADE